VYFQLYFHFLAFALFLSLFNYFVRFSFIESKDFMFCFILAIFVSLLLSLA